MIFIAHNISPLRKGALVQSLSVYSCSQELSVMQAKPLMRKCYLTGHRVMSETVS